MLKSVPHNTASWWLWNRHTDQVRMRCYFYDSEHILEQQDANMMAVETGWTRIPAYTIGDLLPYMGNHSTDVLDTSHMVIHRLVVGRGTRMADAYADCMLKLIDMGHITLADYCVPNKNARP